MPDLRRLWVRLALAFSLLVALSVGLVSFITSQSTTQEFTTYVQGGGIHYFQTAAERLAAYYARNGSWQGVAPLLQSLQRGPGDGLVLADANGIIVADTAGQQLGRPAAEVQAELQVPVMIGNRQVGTLLVSSFSPGRWRMGTWGDSTSGPGQGSGAGRGRGPSGGMPMMPGGMPMTPGGMTTTVLMEPLEQRFLAAVNRSVWITTLTALVGAMVLSALLARQITGPLAALRKGAQRIAAGDFSGRVHIQSKDEVGDLAVSFNAMAEALERNEMARRNMVADVAHELRTPLTVIEGTADAMLDGVFPPTAENLQVIKDQAQMLSQLVGDLRELSLAEAGQLRLERIPLQMEEVIDQAARGAEATAREHGLQLETRTAAGLPPVLADPVRLGQVLNNLLSNAIRHTPAGGKVGIEAKGEGTAIVISVWDTGEGIPAEDLPFVFDRFYRADKSRARRSGGTGLGLAIVKQLVEAHGGQVWAESTPGLGSRFCLTLPLVNASQHAEVGG